MRTAKAKSTSKPPPGIVEALKSKTAALESATALLKAEIVKSLSSATPFRVQYRPLGA
jgi:hypothetical protein